VYEIRVASEKHGQIVATVALEQVRLTYHRPLYQNGYLPTHLLPIEVVLLLGTELAGPA
jgi:hypothetical protein